MYFIRYKLPLVAQLNNPINISGYETYEILLSDLEFNSINPYDIEKLDGQYDWIEEWLNSEYDKKMAGFNHEDVLMEVVYDKGNYIITLVSDKPFDTIVKNNRYFSSDGPWEEITLKEAIERFFEGCIWDGIGENEIGHIKYQFEELEIWMSHDLIEI